MGCDNRAEAEEGGFQTGSHMSTCCGIMERYAIAVSLDHVWTLALAKQRGELTSLAKGGVQVEAVEALVDDLWVSDSAEPLRLCRFAMAVRLLMTQHDGHDAVLAATPIQNEALRLKLPKRKPKILDHKYAELNRRREIAGSFSPSRAIKSPKPPTRSPSGITGKIVTPSSRLVDTSRRGIYSAHTHCVQFPLACIAILTASDTHLPPLPWYLPLGSRVVHSRVAPANVRGSRGRIYERHFGISATYARSALASLILRTASAGSTLPSTPCTGTPPMPPEPPPPPPLPRPGGEAPLP